MAAIRWERRDGIDTSSVDPERPPESWTDHDCVAAYDAISQEWGDSRFDIVEPLVTLGVSLSELDFTQWIRKMDRTRPEFWVRPLTAAPERSVRAPYPLSQNERVKTKEFVTEYIAREQAAGKRPTKTGLEKEAKTRDERVGAKIEEMSLISRWAKMRPGAVAQPNNSQKLICRDYAIIRRRFFT